jgi:phosphatidate cytidylyltransferase
MAATAPRSGRAGLAAPAHNLALRVVSALVLAPLAVGAAYLGGWFFVLFWALAAVVVLWEWIGVTASGQSGERAIWIVAGVGYSAVLLLAPVLLRRDESDGFLALVFLFAVVWSTDVLGYFGGRALGGPKLAPSISPKKTWSGAVAGTLGAMALTAAGARYIGGFNITAIAVLALILSIAAQLGDLMESKIKRHFGAKDAGHIIPGHGGLMDRLDGFWAAALAACLIGLARGGFDGAARGLLVW